MKGVDLNAKVYKESIWLPEEKLQCKGCFVDEKIVKMIERRKISIDSKRLKNVSLLFSLARVPYSSIKSNYIEITLSFFGRIEIVGYATRADDRCRDQLDIGCTGSVILSNAGMKSFYQ